MRAKLGRDPMAGSKKVTLKFIIGLFLMLVQEMPTFFAMAVIKLSLQGKKLYSNYCLYHILLSWFRMLVPNVYAYILYTNLFEMFWIADANSLYDTI